MAVRLRTSGKNARRRQVAGRNASRSATSLPLVGGGMITVSRMRWCSVGEIRLQYRWRRRRIGRSQCGNVGRWLSWFDKRHVKCHRGTGKEEQHAKEVCRLILDLKQSQGLRWSARQDRLLQSEQRSPGNDATHTSNDVSATLL